MIENQINQEKITEAMFNRTHVDNRGRYIYDSECFKLCDDVHRWRTDKIGRSDNELNEMISRLQTISAKKKPASSLVFIYRMSVSSVSSVISIMKTIYEYISTKDKDSELISKIEKAVEMDEYLIAAANIKASFEVESRGNTTIVEKFS